MDNIFNYIHYDMFKVLSSKDREFNYDILIYLYNYYVKILKIHYFFFASSFSVYCEPHLGQLNK